jgi:hypothetical protein
MCLDIFQYLWGNLGGLFGILYMLLDVSSFYVQFFRFFLSFPVGGHQGGYTHFGVYLGGLQKSLIKMYDSGGLLRCMGMIQDGR